jgi:basic membrane lipoprotein Med (substrate-binding protein (PBP1-ABC) superfamily)
MSSQMSSSLLVIAIGVTVLIALAVTSKVIFSQDLSVNDTQNESAVKNQSMMMPGGTMTFGSSLDNARMHLIEAIMDLNEGNIKGAIMQLNMTDQGIKMHEKEMMDMMKSMKLNMSATISKTRNESS